MATVEETYKIALENRNAINTIKDKAKKTGDFPLVSANDTDLVRVTRNGVSSHTPVSDIRSLSGAGEDNVQADWLQPDDQVDSYIQSKPTKLSEFENDLPPGDAITDAHNDTVTGIFTGGEVTINGGNNTLFDVAAGTGVVVDWTDPSTPIRYEVEWDAIIGQSIPDLSESFTNIYISKLGALVKVSGIPSTPAIRRSRIQLQGVLHSAGTHIERVGDSSRPAYEVTQGILDYIEAAGAITKGNTIESASTDLTVKKLSGTTTLPFINRANDLQNPTTKSSAEMNPLPFMVSVRRDGAGDFITAGITELDPDRWDDGSGTLQNVPNNQFTIQRFHFFAGSETVTVSYGQTLYANMDDARADLFLENPELSPILNLGEFITAVLVKQSTTDLSVVANAEFINISKGGVSSGGGASGSGDMLKSAYDTGNTGNSVDNALAFDGRPTTDFVLEADHHIVHDGEMTFYKGIGNTLKTLEAGDWVRGIWNGSEFWDACLYNGGDDTLRASYTIYNYYEY